jgi:hypothetical protein
MVSEDRLVVSERQILVHHGDTEARRKLGEIPAWITAVIGSNQYFMFHKCASQREVAFGVN